jgi:hypothetical protein
MEMLKVKKKNIGHFAVRFLAGARQSDHTCCWNIIFAVHFLAWRTAKGEWAKVVGKAGATGGERSALPIALAQAVGKAGFFANSLVQQFCQQHGLMLLAKLPFPLPTGFCQQPSLPCWRR